MKPRVYIAGPISKGVLADNIAKACQAGIQLMRLGYAPLVPHLTCYYGGDTPETLPCGTTAEDWHGIDLPWVSVASAVLRLPGSSVGADLEVSHAVKLGIPVYFSVKELVECLTLS
jgi:hypothetical protein